MKKNIDIQKSEGVITIVIRKQIEKWKESLLVAWVTAWTLCGLGFIYQFPLVKDQQMKLMFIVLLAFWLYYEFKIGRAMLWRLYGKELIRVEDGKLIIKNAIKSYGKANEYFIENISELGIIKHQENSFGWQMEQSFWSLGGEMVGFVYGGKAIRLGKQISEKEAKQIVSAINISVKVS